MGTMGRDAKATDIWHETWEFLEKTRRAEYVHCVLSSSQYISVKATVYDIPITMLLDNMRILRHLEGGKNL